MFGDDGSLLGTMLTLEEEEVDPLFSVINQKKNTSLYFLYSLQLFSLSMYLPGNFNPRLRQNDLSKSVKKKAKSIKIGLGKKENVPLKTHNC